MWCNSLFFCSLSYIILAFCELIHTGFYHLQDRSRACSSPCVSCAIHLGLGQDHILAILLDDEVQDLLFPATIVVVSFKRSL